MKCLKRDINLRQFSEAEAIPEGEAAKGLPSAVVPAAGLTGPPLKGNLGNKLLCPPHLLNASLLNTQSRTNLSEGFKKFIFK